MKAAVCSLMVGILMIGAGYAQIPTEQYKLNDYRPFEIEWNAASYARQGEVNLRGGGLSFAYYFTPRVGIVADFTAHSDFDTPRLDLFAYRFGPRFISHRPGSRFTLFGEGLLGGSQIRASETLYFGGAEIPISTHVNGLSFAVGGGMDVAVNRWLAVRMFHANYNVNKFGDYGVGDGVHIGAGVVFRIGSSPNTRDSEAQNTLPPPTRKQVYTQPVPEQSVYVYVFTKHAGLERAVADLRTSLIKRGFIVINKANAADVNFEVLETANKSLIVAQLRMVDSEMAATMSGGTTDQLVLQSEQWLKDNAALIGLLQK